MMNGYGTNGWGMSWGMGFGWIIGFIFLIVIIWLLVRTVNQNSSSQSSINKSALDILKERYARGEIDKNDFEERKKDLM